MSDLNNRWPNIRECDKIYARKKKRSIVDRVMSSLCGSRNSSRLPPRDVEARARNEEHVEDEARHQSPVNDYYFNDEEHHSHASGDTHISATQQEDIQSEEPVQKPAPRVRRTRSRHVIDVLPLLTDAAPGGPACPEIMLSFEPHVAYFIWKGHERPPLKIHVRSGQLRQWTFSDEDDREWVSIVRQSGLSHLQSLMYTSFNNPMINAFVERWQPEPNGFDLPFGEMGITLHDVQFILRINVDGEALPLTENLHGDLNEMLVTLGITEEEKKRHEISKRGFPAIFLSNKCASPELQERDPDAVASMYLLYLLHSTILMDKSQHRISFSYLGTVKDHDAVQGISWGSATLAYLYRRLGEGTRLECKQLSGCLTLLEAWIYVHFPMFRPTEVPDWDDTQHWASRWKGGPLKGKGIQYYCQALDEMTTDQVDFVAYPPRFHQRSGPWVDSRFHGLLSCGSITEPYMPDRWGRHYGRVQQIPKPVIMPTKARRPLVVKSYVVHHDPTKWAWAN